MYVHLMKKTEADTDTLNIFKGKLLKLMMYVLQ